MAECYICGKAASTVDHVPPQSYFSTVPQNIIELDACEHCNGSASLDEEYMRATLSAQAYASSPEAQTVWEGSVRRSFRYRPKGLRARLERALTTVEIHTPAGLTAGRLPGVRVDGARAVRVLRKIAKGLYFRDRQTRLEDDELILFRGAEIKLDFELISRSWPEVDMGEGFRFRSLHSNEGSLIWFEFYRTIWWLALTGDYARNYEK